MNAVIPIENISGFIYLIRGNKVMLDQDLAALYEVETKRLKEQVKRNIDRFPEDFMFELSKNEYENLRSQFATSSWGGTRYTPMAFTEHGILMISSVLKSDKAIQVNIQIMRAFTKLRNLIFDNANLRRELEDLRADTDGKFRIVFETKESDRSQIVKFPIGRTGNCPSRRHHCLPGEGKTHFPVMSDARLNPCRLSSICLNSWITTLIC